MTASDIQADQNLSTDFIADRFVSGLVKAQSNTISGGTLTLQGQTWAIGYQSLPYFLESGPTGSNLTAFRKDDRSFIANGSVYDGVVAVADPEADSTFRPTNTVNAVGSKRDGYEAYFSINGPATMPPPWLPPTSTGANIFLASVFSTGNQLIPFGLRGKTRMRLSLTAVQTAVPQIPSLFTVTVTFSDGTTSSRTILPTPGVSEAGAFNLAVGDFNVDSPDIIVSIAISFQYSGGGAYPNTGLTCDVTISNDTLSTLGEAQPGAIIIAAGLSTTNGLVITGITNHEAVPNAALAKNLKTTELVMDVEEDIQAAKMVLANAAHFGLRSIYTVNNYEALKTAGFFKQASMRGSIQGHAAGFLDSVLSVGKTLFPFLKPVLREGADRLHSMVMQGLSAPASSEYKLEMVGESASKEPKQAVKGKLPLSKVWDQTDVLNSVVLPAEKPVECEKEVFVPPKMPDLGRPAVSEPPPPGEGQAASLDGELVFRPVKLDAKDKKDGDEKHEPLPPRSVPGYYKTPPRPKTFTGVFKTWVETPEYYVRLLPHLAESMAKHWGIEDAGALAKKCFSVWQVGKELHLLDHCEYVARQSTPGVGLASSLEEDVKYEEVSLPDEIVPTPAPKRGGFIEQVEGYKSFMTSAYQYGLNRRRLAYCLGSVSPPMNDEPLVMAQGVAVYPRPGSDPVVRPYTFAVTALPFQFSPIPGPPDDQGRSTKISVVYAERPFTNVLGQKGVLYVDSNRFKTSAVDSFMLTAARSLITGAYVTMVSNDIITGDSVGLAAYAAFNFWPTIAVFSGKAGDPDSPLLSQIGKVQEKITLQTDRPMIIVTEEKPDAYKGVCGESQVLLDPRIFKEKPKLFCRSYACAKLAAILAATQLGLTPTGTTESSSLTSQEIKSHSVSGGALGSVADVLQAAKHLWPDWPTVQGLDTLQAKATKSSAELMRVKNAYKAITDRMTAIGMEPSDVQKAKEGKLGLKKKEEKTKPKEVKLDSMLEATPLLRKQYSKETLSLKELLKIAIDHQAALKQSGKVDQLLPALAIAVKAVKTKKPVPSKVAMAVRSLADKAVSLGNKGPSKISKKPKEKGFLAVELSDEKEEGPAEEALEEVGVPEIDEFDFG
jgi:hypothetical protein